MLSNANVCDVKVIENADVVGDVAEDVEESKILKLVVVQVKMTGWSESGCTTAQTPERKSRLSLAKPLLKVLIKSPIIHRLHALFQKEVKTESGKATAQSFDSFIRHRLTTFALSIATLWRAPQSESSIASSCVAPGVLPRETYCACCCDEYCSL